MISEPHCSGHAVLSATAAARDARVMPLIYSRTLAVAALFSAHGLSTIRSLRDLAGHHRVTAGRLE